MTIPNLSRETIEEHTTGGSYDRGKEYLSEGAVRSVKLAEEGTIEAQVQGSDVHPYLVTVRFNEDGISRVKCTCPYYEGSWCKHVAAVLLKTLEDEPLPSDDPATVAELVQALDRSALVDLVERLVEEHPELFDVVKRECDRLERLD